MAETFEEKMDAMKDMSVMQTINVVMDEQRVT